MTDRLCILRLEDTPFPIFLLSIPEFARLSLWIRPRPRAACKILPLPLLTELVGVLHAAVCGCKLICVFLRIFGEIAVPCQWRDGELGASCFLVSEALQVVIGVSDLFAISRGQQTGRGPSMG